MENRDFNSNFDITDQELLDINADEVFEEVLGPAAIVSKEEKEKFVQEQRNKNTVKKTKYALQNFTEFLRRNGVHAKIDGMDPQTLNNHIESYFILAKRSDGEEYEPSSLRCLFNGINRHLQENGYPENMQSSTKFQGSRGILAAKLKVHQMS